MLAMLLAFLRRLRTYVTLRRARAVKTFGRDIHIGERCKLWAPDSIDIGSGVYIGKEVMIEANCTIGDGAIIANRVAVVGRHDHDFRQVGVPVRFGAWVGALSPDHVHRRERAVIGADVWIGYGAIILTGCTVGRGSIVAAGAVVTKDVPPYSIVGGNPARVLRSRFNEDAVIATHEKRIAAGRFVSSERGFQHFVVEPGAVE